MARTKFTFEKRQREIARQQKQKDKAARRAEAKQPRNETDAPALGEEPGTDPASDALSDAAENPCPASPEEETNR
jgi:hypothetical protein